MTILGFERRAKPHFYGQPYRKLSRFFENHEFEGGESLLLGLFCALVFAFTLYWIL